MTITRIPKEWGVLREPRTPKHLRKDIMTHGYTYDEIFDWDTLFNDALDIGHGRTLLIGSPLYELKQLIKFEVDGKPVRHSFHDLTNVTLTLVEASAETLTIPHPKKDLVINVEKLCSDFEGLGCITTMQKNEPIEWIQDWVTYYYTEHNVRGFCVYDNNSDKYTVEELQESLDALNLDGAIIHVVNWCVPKGPNVPPLWDSSFAQFTMFEHSKYKYMWCAKFTLNHDIDEYLVADDIHDVAEQLTKNKRGAIRYYSRNIDPYNESLGVSAHTLPPNERRAKDYYYYSDYNNTDNTVVEQRIFTKWLTIPEYAMEYQWRVHDFHGQNDAIVAQIDSGIYFAHMYALQSGHKDFHVCFHDRNKMLVDISHLTKDERLKRSLDSGFML